MDVLYSRNKVGILASTLVKFYLKNSFTSSPYFENVSHNSLSLALTTIFEISNYASCYPFDLLK